MKHPWLFLDGFWWALVSFRLFFAGFWGFRWFAWHRWCPRFRWSPWLSFSLCVCWVFRGPPPLHPKPIPPLGWSYGMPITLCTPMPMPLHSPMPLPIPTMPLLIPVPLPMLTPVPRLSLNYQDCVCLASYFVKSK